MEKRKIIEKNNRVNFDKDKLTVLLDIYPVFENLDILRERAKEDGLVEKSDFHITLIGSKTGKKIIQKLKGLSDEERREKIKEIQKIISITDWSYDTKSEYYAITKTFPEYLDENKKPESRSSYVQIVELPTLRGFYARLNQILDMKLKVPLPHITLFSISSIVGKETRGIGIYSEKQMKKLIAKKIEL